MVDQHATNIGSTSPVRKLASVMILEEELFLLPGSHQMRQAGAVLTKLHVVCDFHKQINLIVQKLIYRGI